MRNLYVLVLVGLFCGPLNVVYAQEWTSLYGLYEVSVRNPLQFDAFIEANREEFNDGFNVCVNSLFKRFWPTAQQQIEICNQHSNPEWRQKCLQENPEADMAMWAASVSARVNNGLPWCQTYSGSMMCFYEQECPIRMRQIAELGGGIFDCQAMKEVGLSILRENFSGNFQCR